MYDDFDTDIYFEEEFEFEDPEEIFVDRECYSCKGTGLARDVDADCIVCYGEGYL